MSNAVIMQARVGSSRLPGKVLKELCGRPVLEHDILRIRQAKTIDRIIVATTQKEADDAVVQLAKKCGAEVFRGSETDVLCRYYEAAKAFSADVVVRITSDCPLIDPQAIDDVVRCYEEGRYDIVTNVPNLWEEETYPRGMDVEVFSFALLEDAFLHADSPFDREHVTPYLYDHCKKKYCFRYHKNYAKYRLTLDTEEDFQVMEAVYQALYHGTHDFYLEDIIRFLEAHPEIASINQAVKQRLRPEDGEGQV